MDLSVAKQLVEAAQAHARMAGWKMNVAVVGEDGVLVAFARMDGAWKGSADIAIRKARTAHLFNLPTRTLGTLSNPLHREFRDSLYGIEHTNGGLVTFPGGLPTPCGAGIGVSGGSVDQDEETAKAALLTIGVVG